MPTDSLRDAAFCDVLNRELVCALGCTEPIAVAYAAALASQTLGCEPDHMDVACSGNIIKNVKSVTVPNSGGMHGIEAAAVLGAVGGDAKSALEVLESVNDEDRARVAELLADAGYCDVSLVEGVPNLYIKVTATAGGHTAVVEITDHHTNVTCHTLDGIPVCGKSAGECAACAERVVAERAADNADTPMSIDSIIDFIEDGDIEGARAAVERQIELNGAISAEGLAHAWGAEVGRTLLGARADDVACRARARAAAGSDARMSGCEMPVIIVSGSGNQGITASVPVAIYARAFGIGRERLLRAVALADLVTIHQKAGIGCLSAFCGATCAGCGAGAGIAYLLGGDYQAVAHTIVNALAVVSGMVCDGAKPSCAAKIAAAIDAGILGYELYCRGQEFLDGDGIVRKGVDNTIGNVGRMARSGMRETDRVILDIMCGC